MKRRITTRLAVMAVATVFLSGTAYAQSVPDSQASREGSSPSGAAYPNTTVAAAGYLSPGERATILANGDGSVTRSQYLAGMERRWDAMVKNSSGNLPAWQPDVPQPVKELSAPWPDDRSPY